LAIAVIAKPKPRLSPRTWWLAFALTVTLALLLSALAYDGRMPGELSRHELDKVVHFLLAGALVFWLDGALGRRALAIASSHVPLSAIAVLVPTGIDEYLQRYSSARHSSLGDYLADCAGVVTFIWLSRRVLS
jgi:VanZ family protein